MLEICCDLKVSTTLDRIRDGIDDLCPIFAGYPVSHVSVSFSLRWSASGRPVISVNVSTHTCDALVVFADRDPNHISLSVVEAPCIGCARKEIGRDRRPLPELWDKVVFPIADFLRTTYPCQSRIWWCPIAEFSFLPIMPESSVRV